MTTQELWQSQSLDSPRIAITYLRGRADDPTRKARQWNVVEYGSSVVCVIVAILVGVSSTSFWTLTGAVLLVISRAASDLVDSNQSPPILRWKTDIALSVDETGAFADFAEEFFGFRISTTGEVETFEATPTDELRKKFLKPESAALGEMLEPVLWMPKLPN